ncbi:Predicted nucleotidyltransferase [Oceanobacillus limi]|uniref:tRNA(Met) cytidine acetate ligase n=1 Tax=Oceanobacillus limi TaxID=930131 RepID=A0A1I0DCK5_9BACI|nr:nucleotidyltransferase [Oceanobacillus limi]SET30028.1 Predicted nucleotidyltransferase [Oceanobacillus limi]
MRACGLIVEYNPFHNGHVYHLQEAKKTSGADCMIAVMSGSFLQRGEPAIMDKFHRTKAALQTGIDIMLELPYPFAVQSSKLFASGAVRTLHEVGVDTICFGSETGEITPFLTSYETLHKEDHTYRYQLKKGLNKGLSYPEASKEAYQAIGLTEQEMDLSKPNNILGFSYVQAIKDHQLSIEPLTIKRTSNNYHDETITSAISSATSIRRQLIEHERPISNIHYTMPEATINQLEEYKQTATAWHDWERYFPYLIYRVQTMSIDELSEIQGMDEGIEHRIKKTAQKAISFRDWVSNIKTKRYTWTRIQRIFVHLLTNTKKYEMEHIENITTIPYVRLLGLTSKGQAYLNVRKKEMNVPLVTQLSRNTNEMLIMEERATNAYYSVLPIKNRHRLFKQEIIGPIVTKK